MPPAIEEAIDLVLNIAEGSPDGIHRETREKHACTSVVDSARNGGAM
jgi:hypothetical protein